MKKSLLLFLLPLYAFASPTQNSDVIVRAALEQIQWTKDTGDTVTDCSIYVRRVLARAGMPVSGFSSNDFHKVMARYPQWKNREFSAEIPSAEQDSLRTFLNSPPDGTVFLAQWPRVGRSGHTAIVQKVSRDNFVIFQAQQGLTLPHASAARVSRLLYTEGRAHLRLFFE